MNPADIPAELLEAAEAEAAPKKRAKQANYNSLVRRRLSEMGYLPVLTEHYDARTRRKHDLLQFIDFLGLGDGDTLALQITSKANMPSRVKKIASDELAEGVAAVRKAGWKIECWGFWKNAAGRWEVKIVNLS